MRKTQIALLSLLAIGLVPACGDEEPGPETTACPTITGEQHLASADSVPDAIPTMLHAVGRQCALVGENHFRLLRVVDAGGMAMAAGMMPEAVTVTAVLATMPAMGHGPSQAPVIDADDPGLFVVNFQMPGDWRLVLGFQTMATATAQEVVYDIQVQ